VDFGVYLHIPFCSHRCDYCAFATWTDRHHLIGEYLDALTADIARATAAGMPPATSVFVGGGTPTQVPAEALAGVIASIPTAPGAEITVECNPDDVDRALMAALRDGGVNRISLGVQSTVPSVLAALGRRHRPEHVVTAVEAVGGGARPPPRNSTSMSSMGRRARRSISGPRPFAPRWRCRRPTCRHTG
jgi:oxygen-independent coproporphyrinogen-3 oxidase